MGWKDLEELLQGIFRTSDREKDVRVATLKGSDANRFYERDGHTSVSSDDGIMCNRRNINRRFSHNPLQRDESIATVRVRERIETMKFAVAQISDTGTVRGNFAKHKEAMGIAGAEGADYLIFPEMSVTAYATQ